MTDTDHAAKLLSMAQKDLSALAGMSDAETFTDEVFGFHAQQAVEKTLKAWISAQGGTYPFTHDIRLLIIKLEELGCSVEELWDFLELNTFAVQFRYEEMGFADEPLNRADLTERIRRLLNLVNGIIAKQKAGES
jgi:HEPN domain-containing protein